MNLLATMAHRSLAVLLATAALLVQAATATAPATAPTDTPTATASLWSRLWRTADQRGQALLQQGDAAGAAQAFADPERKAHAALQAGDYPGAAQTLAGIDTAEAHYNRGNALAHAGDLQGAIQAYEAALKHNPQHTDARHNRDIVAAALQKQKDDKKDSSQQDKQDKQGKEDGKPGDKAGDKQQDKDNKGGKSDSKPGEQPASAPQPGKPSAAAPATPASAPKDDAAQARRDAEAALGKGTQPPPAPARGGASAPLPGLAGAQDAGKLPPMTEKQIAQDQWLRAIPDDPGGLLRRKFMIQHMLRQQGQKP